MAYHASDREQIELIKKWWTEYGKILIVAIVVGLALGFGIHTWREHRVQNAEQAAQIYQQLLIFSMEDNSESSRYDRVIQLGKRLSQDYPKTPYADFAELLLAKEFVAENKWNEAGEQLKKVIVDSRIASLKQVARLRYARILLMQKQSDQALDVLKTVDDPAYQPLVDDVKGDILTAQGKLADAHKAYQAASQGLAEVLPLGMGADPVITMKLAQPN